VVAQVARSFDFHVEHIDAWLPQHERFAHVLLDLVTQLRRIGLENQIVYAATEVRHHHSFASSGAKDDPDALADLLLIADELQPTAWIGFNGKWPTMTDNVGCHINLRSTRGSRPLLCLRADRPDRCRSAPCRPRAPREDC